MTKGTAGAEEGDNGWPNWRNESVAVVFQAEGPRVCLRWICVRDIHPSWRISLCAAQTFLYNNIIIFTDGEASLADSSDIFIGDQVALRERATIENQFPCARRARVLIEFPDGSALRKCMHKFPRVSDKCKTDAHRVSTIKHNITAMWNFLNLLLASVLAFVIAFFIYRTISDE